MATATPLRNIKALVFDAYGTLFDVFSVTALCEQLFPGNGAALAQLWRAKQLQYSLLRSLMGRYEDFWRLTEDALLYASQSLKLDLTATKQRHLTDASDETCASILRVSRRRARHAQRSRRR